MAIGRAHQVWIDAAGRVACPRCGSTSLLLCFACPALRAIMRDPDPAVICSWPVMPPPSADGTSPDWRSGGSEIER